MPFISAPSRRLEWHLAETTDEDGNVTQRQVVDPSIHPGVKSIARMVIRFGLHLNMSHEIINSANVLIHRFYRFKCFENFDPEVMCLTAIWTAMKMQGTNVDFDARNLAESVMYFLRGSNLSEDREKVIRLKCPSNVAHQMKDYELTLLATTGFYFPPNFRSLVKETGDKIDASIDLAKDAYKIITCSLVGTNLCLMYHPRTVVAIAFYTGCIRTSTGIPNPGNGQCPWFKVLDPSLTQSFLHTMSKSLLKLLPKKNVSIQTKGTEVKAKIEPGSKSEPPSPLESPSPDSGIESPSLDSGIESLSPDSGIESLSPDSGIEPSPSNFGGQKKILT